jgi:hypothetical protein
MLLKRIIVATLYAARGGESPPNANGNKGALTFSVLIF